MDTHAPLSTRDHILSTGRRLTARRGFASLGLAELLKEAGVPKGSFYHYFASKEAYGCALLDAFVADYRTHLDALVAGRAAPARARLLGYLAQWQARQTSPDPQERCLVVRLAAEVAELSPEMSGVLRGGVEAVTAALTALIEQGAADGSLAPVADPGDLARTIYDMWLGASLLAGLFHDPAPLAQAMARTERLLVPAAP